MNQKQFVKLTAGSQVRLTQDHATLDVMGLPHEIAGQTVVVRRTDFSNNQVVFGHPKNPNNSNYDLYATPNCFTDTTLVKIKAPRFSRTDVAKMQVTGSNNLLKSELVQRISQARIDLQLAGVPKDFAKQLKLVNEQIRQAKLIRAAIKLDNA
jgi:hypothetical protein